MLGRRHPLLALTATLATLLPAAAAHAAPVQVDLGVTPQAFTEDAEPLAIFPNVQLSDPDSPTLSKAVVKLRRGASYDVLGMTDGSGKWDPLARTLTLDGIAPVSEWQARLRRVTFQARSEDPADPQREIELLLDEGANQASRRLNMDVLAINDAPIVTVSDKTELSYAENQQGAVRIDEDLTVADHDSDNLQGATVAITGEGASGDVLRPVGALPEGIGQSYDAPSKTLTFTGTAPKATYQSLLSTVEYFNPSDDPGAVLRTIKVTAIDVPEDSGRVGRGYDTRTLNMSTTNDLPVLSGVTPSQTVQENTTPAIAAEALLTDPDSQITRLTVTLGTGRSRGEDYIVYDKTPESPVSGSYSDDTGVFTMTGSAPAAEYANALRRVRFSDQRYDDPTDHTVEGAIEATDAAGGKSEARAFSLKVVPVEDPVRIDVLTGPQTWTEGQQPSQVAALQAWDPDTDDFFRATVQITTGRQPGDELLVPGGSWDAATGTLVFTGKGSITAYQNVLNRIAFRSTSKTPPRGARTIVFALGEDANRGTASTVMNVVPTNDAPVVALADPAVTYTEGTSGVLVDGAMTVTDPDDAELSQAVVSLDGSARTGDLLRVRGALPPGIASAYDAGSRTLTLSGKAPVESYRTALRAVEFLCQNEAPETAARTVRVSVTDAGDPAKSGSDSRRIEVLSTNTPPKLTVDGSPLSAVEGADLVDVAPGLTVADADDAILRSAAVSVAGFQPGQEELAARALPAGLTSTYDAATGRLSITGNAPVAVYQGALRAIGYRFTGDAPDGAAKSVVFTVFDGQSDGEGRRALAVTGQNDRPVLTPTPTVLSVPIAGAPVAVDPTLDIADPDSGELTGARVEIDPGTGDLALPGTFGPVTAAYDAAAGRLTLTGRAGLETYEAALRAVTYRTNLPGDRSVRFVASDGEFDSAVVARSLRAEAKPGNGTPGPAGTTITVGVPDGPVTVPPTGASVNCSFDRGLLTACQIRLIGVDGTALGSGARAGEGPVRVVLNRRGRARLAARPLGMPVVLDGEGTVEDGTVLEVSRKTFLLPDRPVAVSGLFARGSSRLTAAGRRKLAAIVKDAAPVERVRIQVDARTKRLAEARGAVISAALRKTRAKRIVVTRARRAETVRLSATM